MNWAKRLGLGIGVVALAVGGYAAANWPTLRARYVAHNFRSAETDDSRSEWAARLIDLGDAGTPYLTEPFRAGDEPRCAAVVGSLKARLAGVPPSDPRFAALLRPIVSARPEFAPAGVETALQIVPLMAKCPEWGPECRELVRAGLSAPTAAGRVRAIGLTLAPGVGLKAEAAPLLDDPDPSVRRAALLAVGPDTDDGPPAVDDETLFRCLHDTDEDVRELAEAALRSRGLEPGQIVLASMLSSPDPADRLNLLLDLLHEDGPVRDAGPWLERLSRDPDPAVRAGALRAVFESRGFVTAWAARAAEADPDPTVRRLAGYYRDLANSVRQTGAYGP